jgi:hypothetical protein
MHTSEGERTSYLVPFNVKPLIIHEDLTPDLISDYIPKAPFPHTHTLRVRPSKYEWVWGRGT